MAMITSRHPGSPRLSSSEGMLPPEKLIELVRDREPHPENVKVRSVGGDEVVLVETGAHEFGSNSPHLTCPPALRANPSPTTHLVHFRPHH